MLGKMQGGYNVATLVEALDTAALAPTAAEALKHTLLVFDAKYTRIPKALFTLVLFMCIVYLIDHFVFISRY